MKEFEWYDVKCPKCGYMADDVGYNPPYTQYKAGVFDPNEQANVPINNMGEKSPEYLMRTCARCEYRWQEECIEIKENREDTVRIEGELKECDAGASFADYEMSSQDKLAGDKMAEVIGDTWINSKLITPVTRWKQIMKALRVHGFKIIFK